MRRIVFSAQARRNARAIWDYIAAESTTAVADRLCAKLYDALELIARMPGMGHTRSDVKDPQYRFRTVKPYVMAYHYSSRRVTVVRILHGGMDFRRQF